MPGGGAQWGGSSHHPPYPPSLPHRWCTTHGTRYGRTPFASSCTTPHTRTWTSRQAHPPPPPAPLPVLTGRPFTQLAQPVLQPGTARAAQPQCQHRQQHGAQQQSRGEGTAPYESRPSAPHGLHKAPLFVPPHPPPVPSSALTSCWCCCGAAVLAAPRPGAVTGWGGPALLTVAVPVVVAHLGGGDTVMLSLGHW